MRPPSTNVIPASRCVERQTRSLDSVHGVRTPIHQFDRTRGSTFPRTRNITPRLAIMIRSTAGIGHSSATPIVITCTTAMKPMIRFTTSQNVGSKRW